MALALAAVVALLRIENELDELDELNCVLGVNCVFVLQIHVTY